MQKCFRHTHTHIHVLNGVMGNILKKFGECLWRNFLIIKDLYWVAKVTCTSIMKQSFNRVVGRLINKQLTCKIKSNVFLKDCWWKWLKGQTVSEKSVILLLGVLFILVCCSWNCCTIGLRGLKVHLSCMSTIWQHLTIKRTWLDLTLALWPHDQKKWSQCCEDELRWFYHR